MEIYISEIGKDKLPNEKLRAYAICKGDSFYISVRPGDTIYRVGDYYSNDDKFIVTKVVRKRKRWWEFWKKRTILGYNVLCTRE